jgi:hypothetical protein
MFANDRQMSAALDRYLTAAPDGPDAPYVEDFDGRAVEVGTRVRYFDYDPHHPEWSPENDGRYIGVVVEITDWDGDCDDEGRSISIPPSVVVEFADGSRESYRTCDWQYPHSYDALPTEGKVEELAAVGPPDVGSVALREGAEW